MSDEKPVPDTLESIASQIRELSTSINGRFAQVDGRSEQIDGRFAQIDTRFDQIDTRFDELKAQLRTEIEAVRGDIRLVAEAQAAQHAHNAQNEAEHRAFLKRIENHEVRVLALEGKQSSA